MASPSSTVGDCGLNSWVSFPEAPETPVAPPEAPPETPPETPPEAPETPADPSCGYSTGTATPPAANTACEAGSVWGYPEKTSTISTTT